MTVARFFPSFLASFFFFLLILVFSSFLLSRPVFGFLMRFWRLCPLSRRHDSFAPWFKTVMSRGHSRKWVRGVFQHSKRCKNTILRNILYLFSTESRFKGRARAASHLPDLRKPGKTGENRGKPGRFSERHAPLLRDQTGHLGAKNGT